MEQYEINIPNEKATSYKLVSFIIAVINAAAFIYFLLQGGNRWITVAGIIIALLCALALVTTRKLNGPVFLSVEAGFALLAILWISTGNILPGLLMLIFSSLGFYTNRKSAIRFTPKGILYPSIPVKFFSWELIDFAMIKDGILTIELKDNRVFQFTLSPQEAASVDEENFNRFCNEQKSGTGLQ